VGMNVHNEVLERDATFAWQGCPHRLKGPSELEF
jgi:hypothetical protein